ncbi:type II toxin-antitoxin system RelE/ParE family toxin [Methylobacterium sp. J-070]|uniref:type II toxin-antitoxin system RelE/ParE family toxin n=1 Tax=Methylobacterium sp. J-070 TaxID=2836650 RepID=UPI001FBA8EF9|nr:type II toxin-antitoxin system RelE/ParE family toxin [Methylobacterium sp. J-070]MCJ2052740.1 type II toxin-antitoxin system RelE/ParE family toxin [Methylobacterium sp. J-070]
MSAPRSRARTFKTAWFARAARKAHVTDQDLCAAILEVAQGQADDLGGGVFKKRLNRNMHRSVILAKIGPYWLYQYLFAKKDRPNIDVQELTAFRLLAKNLATATDADLARLVAAGYITDICDDREAGL